MASAKMERARCALQPACTFSPMRQARCLAPNSIQCVRQSVRSCPIRSRQTLGWASDITLLPRARRATCVCRRDCLARRRLSVPWGISVCQQAGPLRRASKRIIKRRLWHSVFCREIRRRSTIRWRRNRLLEAAHLRRDSEARCNMRKTMPRAIQRKRWAWFTSSTICPIPAPLRTTFQRI